MMKLTQISGEEIWVKAESIHGLRPNNNVAGGASEILLFGTPINVTESIVYILEEIRRFEIHNRVENSARRS